jgi:hypothetical protein
MPPDSQAYLPKTCLPPWGVANLPEPRPLSWRHWAGFLGPGIVMCGIQIGGGEWLFGPEITARYGGGLMWIATVAIVVQVFYNIECGRYALYCGEPVFTGFMRLWPGPGAWISLVLLLNFGAFIPGLSTHGAAVASALILGKPPGEEDRWLVTLLAYLFLGLVTLPILVGGKIYNMLQVVMTTKVVCVLGFCLFVGFFFVGPANWLNVFSGFLKFGNVPVADGRGGETVVNAFTHLASEGAWPVIALGNIAVLGAFAGYAGGGGLSNSTYSNYVRDKGWGMGSLVGAIPSAVGGRNITLSHLGKVFPLTQENLRRWSGWWRYILTDQLLVWGPGCFMGMALPALLSIQFSPASELYHQTERLDWSQAIITADGMHHALTSPLAQTFWVLTLLVGLMVLLPSQMSIVEDFSRRWTDILWSGSARIRKYVPTDRVDRIYYTLLAGYVLWSFFCAWLFTTWGHPKLMVLVIANLNNLALGITAILVLWVNTKFLPPQLRPRWYNRLGLVACCVFYFGMAVLVFVTKQVPMIRELFS